MRTKLKNQIDFLPLLFSNPGGSNVFSLLLVLSKLKPILTGSGGIPRRLTVRILPSDGRIYMQPSQFSLDAFYGAAHYGVFSHINIFKTDMNRQPQVS